MDFRGHEINQNHYRAVRQIDGFYPDRGTSSDALVFRWAVGIAVVLIALYAIGVNV